MDIRITDPIGIPVVIGPNSQILRNVKPADAKNSIITPNIVTADNYLNDIILFDLQQRFEPTTLVRTFTIPNQVQRDFADFAMVALSDTTPAFYSISLVTPKYKRESVDKVIDMEIRELV